jgi:hypothetical protein
VCVPSLPPVDPPPPPVPAENELQLPDWPSRAEQVPPVLCVVQVLPEPATTEHCWLGLPPFCVLQWPSPLELYDEHWSLLLLSPLMAEHSA